MPTQAGQFISLNAASKLTANFRRLLPPGQPIAFRYDKSLIQTILDQAGCEGIRVYLGNDDSGNLKLVFVGVDGSGNDQYTQNIADFGTPCPADCSSNNPLNTNQ